MERSIALKKLRRIFGKSFAYRVDPKAPTPEQRAQAREDLKTSSILKDGLAKKLEARRNELLKADAEYQALLADCAGARKSWERLMSLSGWYKITVGTANDLFFHVEAQGDSWEDVLAKLAAKGKKAA